MEDAMISPQTKRLVDLLAKDYGGNFLLVPVMIYDILVAKYNGKGAEMMLKRAPAGLWKYAPLPLMGSVGGEPAFTVMLHEEHNHNGVVTGARLMLLPRKPQLELDRVIEPDKIIELRVEEKKLDEGDHPDYKTRRSAKLIRGHLLDGYELMPGSVDHYALVREIEDIAEVCRHFETLVPRKHLRSVG